LQVLQYPLFQLIWQFLGIKLTKFVCVFAGGEGEPADGVQVPRRVGQLHAEDMLEDAAAVPQGGRPPHEEIPEGARGARHLVESRQAVGAQLRLEPPDAGGTVAARLPRPKAAAAGRAGGHVAATPERPPLAARAAQTEARRARFSAPVAKLLRQGRRPRITRHRGTRLQQNGWRSVFLQSYFNLN